MELPQNSSPPSKQKRQKPLPVRSLITPQDVSLARLEVAGEAGPRALRSQRRAPLLELSRMMMPFLGHVRFDGLSFAIVRSRSYRSTTSRIIGLDQ